MVIAYLLGLGTGIAATLLLCIVVALLKTKNGKTYIFNQEDTKGL